MKELVIAHYEEDLGWTQSHRLRDWHLKPYHKHTGKRPGLPNIGREAGTYLHHIIEFYGSLAEETVFCQGDPFAHCPGFFDGLDSGDVFLGEVTRCTPQGLPHADWVKMPAYCDVFEIPLPGEFVFAAGAQYRVTKGQILSRGVPFYAALLALCQCDQTAPWTLERLWPAIWGLQPQSP